MRKPATQGTNQESKILVEGFGTAKKTLKQEENVYNDIGSHEENLAKNAKLKLAEYIFDNLYYGNNTEATAQVDDEGNIRIRHKEPTDISHAVSEQTRDLQDAMKYA